MSRYPSQPNTLCSVGPRSAEIEVPYAGVPNNDHLQFHNYHLETQIRGRVRDIKLRHFILHSDPAPLFSESDYRKFLHPTLHPERGSTEDQTEISSTEPYAPVADIPSANPLIGRSICTLSGGGTSFFTEIGDQTIYIYRTPLFKCDWFLRRTVLCGGASGIRKSFTTSLSSPIHSRRQPSIQKGSNVKHNTTAAVAACIGDNPFRPQGRNFHPYHSNYPAEVHSKGAGRLRRTTRCGEGCGYRKFLPQILTPARGSSAIRTVVSSPEPCAPVADAPSAYPIREHADNTLRTVEVPLCTVSGLTGTAYHNIHCTIHQPQDPCISLSHTPGCRFAPKSKIGSSKPACADNLSRLFGGLSVYFAVTRMGFAFYAIKKVPAWKTN